VDHLAEFAQTVIDVLALITVPIAAEDKDSFTGEFVCKGIEEAQPGSKA